MLEHADERKLCYEEDSCILGKGMVVFSRKASLCALTVDPLRGDAAKADAQGDPKCMRYFPRKACRCAVAVDPFPMPRDQSAARGDENGGWHFL